MKSEIKDWYQNRRNHRVKKVKGKTKIPANVITKNVRISLVNTSFVGINSKDAGKITVKIHFIIVAFDKFSVFDISSTSFMTKNL